MGIADFIVILLAVAISQAVAIAAAALLAAQRYPANRYLSALMLVLAFGLGGEVLRRAGLVGQLPLLYLGAATTPFLIGPLVLGYARSTACSPRPLSR